MISMKPHHEYKEPDYAMRKKIWDSFLHYLDLRFILSSAR